MRGACFALPRNAGVDGKIAYYGGPGPGGFKPGEVEKWLKGFVENKKSRE